MRRPITIVGVCIVLSILCASAHANTTPTSSYGLAIEPYAWDFNSTYAARQDIAQMNHPVTRHYNVALTYDPTVTYETVETFLGDAIGCGFGFTHGNATGAAYANVYPPDTTGAAKADSVYFTDTYRLYRGAVAGVSDHVGYRYSHLAEYVWMGGAIWMNVACYGDQFDNWVNADYVCMPIGLCTTGSQGINAFFGALREGENADGAFDEMPSGWTETSAIGTTDQIVPAPMVAGYSGYSGQQIDNVEGLDLDFTCDVNTSQSAESAVFTEGPFYVEDAYWVGSNRLHAEIAASDTGKGYIVASAIDIESARTSLLWMAPGDYRVRIKNGDGSAADVSGMRYVQADKTVRFKVTVLFETRDLFLMGSDTSVGPWTEVGRITDPQPGEIVFDVSSTGFKYFQLFETETNDNVRYHMSVQVEDTVPPLETIPATEGSNVEWMASVAQAFADRPQRQMLLNGPNTKVAYYYPGSHTSAYQVLASTAQARGWTAYERNIDGYPSDVNDWTALANAIRNQIAIDAGNGVTVFCLVGRDNDGPWFDGPLWPQHWVTPEWQTQRTNRIAAGYQGNNALIQIPCPRFDTNGRPTKDIGYWSPYREGDGWYIDLDGDAEGRPDDGLYIGRVPLADPNRALEYAYKVQSANYEGYPGFNNVLYCIGDMDHTEAGDGEQALATYAATSALLNGLNPIPLYESDLVFTAETNYGVASEWNSRGPGMINYFSVYSKAYATAAFVTEPFWGDSVWTTGYLWSKMKPFVLGATCATWNFAWAEDVDLGTPPQLNMLPDMYAWMFGYSRGPIAGFGPSCGSWDAVNHLIAVAVTPRYTANVYQSPVFACWDGIREVWDTHGAEPHVRDGCLVYNYIGDPTAVVMTPTIATGILEPMPVQYRFSAGNTFPNPFRHNSTFDFTLSRKGPAMVYVYDVGGRLVRTLVDGLHQAGPHRVVWDGRTDRGTQASSGLYFLRLQTSEANHSRKTLLLK
ncbi:MAG: FlgD immunoglobulin-like domain containing protein [Gemmatimonadota bacterium]|jgi:hypothetical protein|nr:FlgD immunoglobulin-like domain containing protein [Gemmatimonadota bacterium]